MQNFETFHFHRYHALGNDYLVIDPHYFHLFYQEALTPALIKKICHRNFGVGSDGILYGPLKEPYQKGEFHLRIFNPDGSEAEKSGNGLRIFARYLQDLNYCKDSQFIIHTPGGVVHGEYLPVLPGKLRKIKIQMGAPSFLASHLGAELGSSSATHELFPHLLTLSPELTALKVYGVSMGNPHCVIPFPVAKHPQAQVISAVSEELAREWGPLVENHPLFKNRINMQLLQVINRQRIKIEIWERGAGYTLASGSSSCASAVAARRLDLVDAALTVEMPGGEIEIEIKGPANLPSEVWMTGPVESICRGLMTDDFLKN